MRGAAWYVLHLVSGGLAASALMFGVPTAVLVVAREVGGATGTWVDLNGGALGGVEGWWAIPVALGLVLVTVGVVAGLGMAMASVAPVLLGPSEEERLQALEAEAERLTERNRLARELHDSVGHALTVTTVQASAALRVFDTDPEFAKRAISAVEETGRAAMEDLDHMLRVLRTDDETPRLTAPQRTLADLDRLFDETRAAGIAVESTVGGDVGRIPRVVSREAYRIVQEGLTNAVRHAKPDAITVGVRVGEQAIEVDVTNPLPAEGSSVAGGPFREGRGLRGMRERVGALGGTLSAGPHDGVWVVRARVPVSPVSERRRRS
jgi:signal transduction histidine kinase